ncbi:hypothetical protein [Pseudovibrio japonicus]|uniref:hypothetical protein n=1 Tax=Pseudovibrio japonicus TaxID=366534 RepID=UPI00188A0AFB|nr:hypothetical protein [Pseudovibrio japonicus]
MVVPSFLSASPHAIANVIINKAANMDPVPHPVEGGVHFNFSVVYGHGVSLARCGCEAVLESGAKLLGVTMKRNLDMT